VFTVCEDSRGCQTQTGFASTAAPCPAASPAGVEGFGVNTLRHSAAVDWLESGVHIKAVADLLGHSSIAITGDVYGHTSDDTARAAVDGLSGRLGL
jgi:integrase